jgi:predicted ABC-type ATPase
MSRPQLWVFAGPNGAGKSTLTDRYVGDRLPIINPDVVALALDPASRGQAAALRAGRLVLQQQEEFLTQRKNFGRETTLTGNDVPNLMRRASAAGFKVNLVYVGLDDVKLSLRRVATRVADGGHDIARHDILRRYDRSIANLTQIIAAVDRVYVFDNSERRRRLVFSREDGRTKFVSKNLPAWAEKAIPASLHVVEPDSPQ